MVCFVRHDSPSMEIVIIVIDHSVIDSNSVIDHVLSANYREYSFVSKSVTQNPDILLRLDGDGNGFS